MSLKDELDQFSALFKHHLKGSTKATLRWVTATSIDWDGKLMDATDSDDLPYYDVLLGVGSIAVKPVLNTDCLIAIVEDDECSAFLLYANEVELLQYNAGENGGLANTVELKAQLAKLTARVDGIINAIKNAVPQTDNSGAALQATIVTALSLLVDKEDFTKIEDIKITH
jgi:hypothetical protein